MKKQKTLAVLLSAAMVAGAIPTAALAEVVGSNSDSGVKAAELSEVQEIEEQNEDSEDETGSGYVLMNVPYDEVYGKDIENKTKVDAVSSATMKKTKKKTVVNGTYHSNDGREIKGAIIPVLVDNLSRLEKFKKVSASNADKVKVASASDSIYNDNLFNLEDDYAYAVLPKEYTPKVYKELSVNENGELVFSEFKGNKQEIDTAPTIVACSGRYQPEKKKTSHIMATTRSISRIMRS